MIINPILKGFHADPAICRVGDDYYIAVSTFEWFPGVQIYHSKNLADWQLVSRPLNNIRLLDMRGNPDSCGVWAPCLSHADGKFWLCYTDVKRFDGNFKDTHNYITSCETIDGHWSDPVYINSSGFDPSLFHDDNGKKYHLNMIWDHRPNRTFFRGIIMQEYDAVAGKLIGSAKMIFDGTASDGTEGPHILKKNDWYYLITAEGGTGYEHAVTIARSKDIWGPYEVDPAGHALTARGNPDNPIQRSAHGSICDTHLDNSTYYFAHLMSRPLNVDSQRRSPLGRETGLQKMTYTADGWFRLENGGNEPMIEVEALPVSSADLPLPPIKDDFNDTALDTVYQWLRTPCPDDIFTLSARSGYLRLIGRESLGSHFTQALVARRQTSHKYSASTALDFHPTSFQHMAGLVAYYNGHKHHYFYKGFDDKIGCYLGIMSCNGNQDLVQDFPLLDNPIVIDSDKEIHMKVSVDQAQLKFYWSYDGDNWTDVGVTLDASILSDEAGKGEGANFTGAFVGMACQDLTGMATSADFDYFSYQDIP